MLSKKQKLITKYTTFLLLANALATACTVAAPLDKITVPSTVRETSQSDRSLGTSASAAFDSKANTEQKRMGQSSKTWTPSAAVLDTSRELQVAKDNMQLATKAVEDAKGRVKTEKQGGQDPQAAMADLAQAKSQQKIAKDKLKIATNNARDAYKKQKQERTKIDQDRKKQSREKIKQQRATPLKSPAN
jgi:hypothetical protein